MEVYVGTSGWAYPWNEGGDLKWYVENTGFNAVELNASFYRFPFRNQVRAWSRYRIKWAVKVHRLITHVKRLKDLESWKKFEELMSPLDPVFYLFQLPPNFKYNEENLRRVKAFEEAVGERMAVEFRDPEWYRKDLGLEKATVVSIDSPMGTFLVNNSGTVYLRMHGRTEWYWYEYSEGELRDLADRVLALKPSRLFVFFNNDLWMLENGRQMMALLRELTG
jgi:uncharacterized protein YecE (DUF72 family)